MRRFILLFVFLLTASTSLIAQDDAIPAWLADGWTYERACLPEAPTEPPADWTFEGTLLYWGNYGIHGYRQGWETTRILAFIDDIYGYRPASAFSPDLKQYAIAEGENIPDPGGHGTWNITRIDYIKVFQISPDDPRQRYHVEWYYRYSDSNQWCELKWS